MARDSLSRWDGVTHAIVDIIDAGRDRMFYEPAAARDLARTTNTCFTVRLVCGRRCKYSGTMTNKVTNKLVTCLWCAAERNL